MRTHRRLRPATAAAIVLTLAATLPLAAQDPTPEDPPVETPVDIAAGDPQDLAAFARRVAAAHGSADRPEPLDRFRAEIRITPASRDAERIEVDLRASFVAPDLLRYRIAEGGKVLERGRDAEGMWMRDGDQLVALDRGERARDFAADRRTLGQHVRLARQLLAFLDPAAIVAGLEAARGPVEETFRLGPAGRGVEIPADAVEGEIDAFPLFAPTADGETAARVRLKLWFAKDTGRLAAARAVPLDAERRIAGTPELYLLREYQAHAGVQLPLSLLIFRGGGAKPSKEAAIELRAIDLDQGFDAGRLARTSR